jgi:ERF superfamily
MNIEILRKLAQFKKLVPVISKEGKNPAYKNAKYARIQDIQLAIREPLLKAGLFISQSVEETGLITMLFDLDGNHQSFTYPMPSFVDKKSQELGSAITYARRYALSSILDLIIDDPTDDDGNASSLTYDETQKYLRPQANSAYIEPVEKPTIFLSENQLKQYVSSEDVATLEMLLKAKVTKEGNPFRMKATDRKALEGRLSDLMNKELKQNS